MKRRDRQGAPHRVPGAGFAVLRWKRRNPNYLAVFNFHQVTPTFRPGFHSEWTWTSLAGFDEGLDYLSRRFTVLRLADAQDQLREGRLRGPCAAITFDDGDESVAHYCAPLLEKRGLPATFFINSASLQGDGHYWFSILNHLRRGPAAGRCRLAEAELKHKNDTLRTTTDPALYVRLRGSRSPRGEGESAAKGVRIARMAGATRRRLVRDRRSRP